MNIKNLCVFSLYCLFAVVSAESFCLKKFMETSVGSTVVKIVFAAGALTVLSLVSNKPSWYSRFVKQISSPLLAFFALGLFALSIFAFFQQNYESLYILMALISVMLMRYLLKIEEAGVSAGTVIMHVFTYLTMIGNALPVFATVVKQAQEDKKEE